MDWRIVYATSRDGIRVACSVRGSGFPLVTLGLPPLSHARLPSPIKARQDFAERLARRHTLVSIDLRGCGLADRHATVHTFDDYCADILAILDALEIPAADLHAAGVRSPVAIRFAARHPERVRRLLLQAVTVGPTAAAGRPLVEPAAARFFADDWIAYLQTLASRLMSSETDVPALVQYMLECTDPLSMRAALEALNNTDIRDDLPLLRCPTLVAEMLENTLIEPGHAQRFQELVPHARLACFPNRARFGWLEDMAEAIERFETDIERDAGAEVTMDGPAGLSPR